MPLAIVIYGGIDETIEQNREKAFWEQKKFTLIIHSSVAITSLTILRVDNVKCVQDDVSFCNNSRTMWNEEVSRSIFEEVIPLLLTRV